MKNRLSLLIVLIAVLLIAGSTHVLGTHEPGGTHADRPIYQKWNSVQNIFENQQAWTEYTNDLDNEWLNATDAAELTNAVGENFSVTMEMLNYMDTAGAPKQECAGQFWLAVYTVTKSYAVLYGSMYYNMTADVGEPINAETAFAVVQQDEEFWYSLKGIDQKCWDRVDV